MTDEFCSMSIERSRKDSSREDTYKPDHRGPHYGLVRQTSDNGGRESRRGYDGLPFRR